jgi:uncharacterized membrane protein (UPF0136 family)
MKKLSFFNKIFGTTRRSIISSIIAILSLGSYFIASSYDLTRQSAGLICMVVAIGSIVLVIAFTKGMDD